MKRFITTILLGLISIALYSQPSRSDRLYEITGLPDSDEITDSLKIAIPLLLVGFFITYIFAWGKKDSEKKDDSSSNIGCIGMVIMAVGAFYLLPLLTWVEFIFVNIMSFVIAVVVIGVIGMLIYSAVTKK